MSLVDNVSMVNVILLFYTLSVKKSDIHSLKMLYFLLNLFTSRWRMTHSDKHN